MFTGIVEAAVPAHSLQTAGSGARLVLPAPGGPRAPERASEVAWEVARGQSIAVAGACLTVADLLDPRGGGSLPDGSPGADMVFDLSAETLACTWLGARAPGPGGPLLNLERALRLGARLDGHLVAGHVDGVGRIAAIEDVGDGGRLFDFEVPPELERYLVDKGSITVDGISLTVVAPTGGRFQVAVIPLTLAQTNLGAARPGDPVHLEADMVGKWIERLLAARGAFGASA